MQYSVTQIATLIYSTITSWYITPLATFARTHRHNTAQCSLLEQIHPFDIDCYRHYKQTQDCSLLLLGFPIDALLDSHEPSFQK
jgi:hypothetical protein